MDYLYSTVIDPSTYNTEGLCDGIDVRKNDYTSLEDRGAIRLHHDWTKYIGPCREYRGTLGPEYSFMSVAVPECIPERLEIISYANELAFAHDGESSFILLVVNYTDVVQKCRCDRSRKSRGGM